MRRKGKLLAGVDLNLVPPNRALGASRGCGFGIGEADPVGLYSVVPALRRVMRQAFRERLMRRGKTPLLVSIKRSSRRAGQRLRNALRFISGQTRQDGPIMEGELKTTMSSPAVRQRRPQPALPRQTANSFDAGINAPGRQDARARGDSQHVQLALSQAQTTPQHQRKRARMADQGEGLVHGRIQGVFRFRQETGVGGMRSFPLLPSFPFLSRIRAAKTTGRGLTTGHRARAIKEWVGYSGVYPWI